MAGRALLVYALCALCCAAGGGWAWPMEYCKDEHWTLLKAVKPEKCYTELLQEYCGRNTEFVARAMRNATELEKGGPCGAELRRQAAVGDDQGGGSRAGTGHSAAAPSQPGGATQRNAEESPVRAHGAQEAGGPSTAVPGAAPTAGGGDHLSPESGGEQTALSSATAGGVPAVDSPTQEGTVGNAAGASPPESAVQRSPVQRDNTPAATAVAGEASDAAQDTPGGGESNNLGSISDSSPAVQPQPASSVGTNEAGQREQEQPAVPTPKQETETSGERGEATQPAAGTAAQAATTTTTNSTSATKAVSGDSDGSSTAAAHSASPLALLLLLACAAAAAVLAA
ncbi:mucin-associated surface protein (MASP) [Trypanosoma conorhini]|uniref:Mucin-associated surface protein (MASP) n=1 Tax=Trypanosoma conorhini TaxID=83891 RepID=A0A422NET1_9TRYP|nr:mucin-associated surface protein (MASP) [Trypanosoma conorhini]RNF03971.1 mucin-associated surface protein (MASP) [Trypanosoma conorhini]